MVLPPRRARVRAARASGRRHGRWQTTRRSFRSTTDVLADDHAGATRPQSRGAARGWWRSARLFHDGLDAMSRADATTGPAAAGWTRRTRSRRTSTPPAHQRTDVTVTCPLVSFRGEAGRFREDASRCGRGAGRCAGARRARGRRRRHRRAAGRRRRPRPSRRSRSSSRSTTARATRRRRRGAARPRRCRSTATSTSGSRTRRATAPASRPATRACRSTTASDGFAPAVNSRGDAASTDPGPGRTRERLPAALGRDRRPAVVPAQHAERRSQIRRAGRAADGVFARAVPAALHAAQRRRDARRTSSRRSGGWCRSTARSWRSASASSTRCSASSTSTTRRTSAPASRRR